LSKVRVAGRAYTFCLQPSFFRVNPSAAVSAAAHRHPQRAPSPLTFTANFVLGKTGNPNRVALANRSHRSALQESRRRRATVRRNRDCASHCGKSFGRPGKGHTEKARRRRGKAAQRPATQGQIPPPSQETGEVRSPRASPYHRANLQAPNACGSGGQK
jgi:hypothetical protein